MASNEFAFFTGFVGFFPLFAGVFPNSTALAVALSARVFTNSATSASFSWACCSSFSASSTYWNAFSSTSSVICFLYLLLSTYVVSVLAVALCLFALSRAVVAAFSSSSIFLSAAAFSSLSLFFSSLSLFFSASSILFFSAAAASSSSILFFSAAAAFSSLSLFFSASLLSSLLLLFSSFLILSSSSFALWNFSSPNFCFAKSTLSSFFFATVSSAAFIASSIMLAWLFFSSSVASDAVVVSAVDAVVVSAVAAASSCFFFSAVAASSSCFFFSASVAAASCFFFSAAAAFSSFAFFAILSSISFTIFLRPSTTVFRYFASVSFEGVFNFDTFSSISSWSFSSWSASFSSVSASFNNLIAMFAYSSAILPLPLNNNPSTSPLNFSACFFFSCANLLFLFASIKIWFFILFARDSASTRCSR